jgi:hypothetical protein
MAYGLVAVYYCDFSFTVIIYRTDYSSTGSAHVKFNNANSYTFHIYVVQEWPLSVCVSNSMFLAAVFSYLPPPTCFVIRGCVYIWVLECVGVLVTCVLVFTVFCIVSFMYIYSYLLLV